MPLVERRYAGALVDVSASTGAIDNYQQEFNEVVGIFSNQQEFRLFITNPKIRKDIKKAVVVAVFQKKIRVEIINFVMLLIDKGRIKLLPGIYDEFVRIADKKRNILSIKIISGFNVDERQIEHIKEKYRKIYNAVSVKAVVEIDENLIGGIKVMIGDKVVDGTAKGRLQNLKELLIMGSFK